MVSIKNSITGVVLDNALQTLSELNCSELRYKNEEAVLQIVLFTIATNTLSIRTNRYLIDF